MSEQSRVGRRGFLKNAGITALVGSVAGRTSLGAALPDAVVATSDKYNFDEVFNRIGTDSVKFDQQLANYGAGSVEVGMGIADMDFRAAPSITKALKARLEHENWGYLHMPKAVADSVINWNKRRYNVSIEPSQMVLAAGVHPALISALWTFSPRGSKVLLLTPTYNGFYTDLRYSFTLAEESPLKMVDGRYSIDFDDFERRITHETNTFILCNPNNPTGNCWTPEELTRLGEICLRRRVVVLADEIHCDFVTKGQKYTPFASLPNKAIVNNSITFKAASKTFGLAAHKIAWYHSTNPELLARMAPNHRADLNTLGIVANRAAYEGGEDWLDQLLPYLDANHEFAVDYIKRHIPSIKAVKPQGTYLAWLDVTDVARKINAKAKAEEASAAQKMKVTPEQIVERFLVKEAKVHLNQGASYGRGGENHMRMNLATSRKMIEKALGNIANAVNNL